MFINAAPERKVWLTAQRFSSQSRKGDLADWLAGPGGHWQGEAQQAMSTLLDEKDKPGKRHDRQT